MRSALAAATSAASEYVRLRIGPARMCVCVGEGVEGRRENESEEMDEKGGSVLSLGIHTYITQHTHARTHTHIHRLIICAT